MDTAWLDKMDTDNTATWPTKKDLRDNLRVTDRTIERWVLRGKLRTTPRREQGKKSAPCYHPDDVRILAKEVIEVTPVETTDATVVTSPTRQGRPTDVTVMPASDSTGDGSDRHAITAKLSAITAVLTPFDVIKIMRSVLSPKEKTHLSLKESAQLSGLSQDRLRKLAYAGKIPALKGNGKSGRWVFSRADLEVPQRQNLIEVIGLGPVKQRTATATASVATYPPCATTSATGVATRPAGRRNGLAL